MNAVTEKKESEVAQVSTSDMTSMIERFVKDPTVDVGKLEKLFDLQERMFKRDAEMAFNQAMRRVQEAMPKIKRDKRNDQTSSNYATLESLNQSIVPVYTGEGFSLSFGTSDCPIADHYRVTCVVSHIGGHSRSYQADVPKDINGLKGNANKTPTHAFGSSMSYGRRYVTLLVFNLTLTDEDDDGNGAGSLEYVTADQADTIDSLIKDVSADQVQFYGFLTKALKVAISKASEIPANSYEYAVNCLNAKRKVGKKAA